MNFSVRKKQPVCLFRNVDNVKVGCFSYARTEKSTTDVTLLQTGNSFAMQWGIILPYFMANASRKNVVPMLTVQLESIASHYRATRVQQWHSQRFDEKCKTVMVPKGQAIFLVFNSLKKPMIFFLISAPASKISNL